MLNKTLANSAAGFYNAKKYLTTSNGFKFKWFFSYFFIKITLSFIIFFYFLFYDPLKLFYIYSSCSKIYIICI